MIKLRAFANAKMYYPTEEMWWYFTPSGYWSLNIGDSPGEIICDSLESDNPHLMQFTGLLDKKGVEFYEGDILNWIGLIFPITVDGFHGYRFMFGEDQLTKAFAKEGKIIGNIYENPDLLI